MFKDNPEDTISAISTAQGEGGIGIVRISGRRALAIANKIFVPIGRKKVMDLKGYTMHYGKICDGGKIIDEAILTVMRKPNSYTREDVVEINCHGSIVALRKVLDLTLNNGARLAGPGEFTKRAFLNGRIDLAQAEAVIDIIRAKTDSALKVSLGQLNGGLSREINKIRKGLLDILAPLEAKIDFPEEDIGTVAKYVHVRHCEGAKRPKQSQKRDCFAPSGLAMTFSQRSHIQEEDAAEMSWGLAAVEIQLNKLLDGASCGRILREGIHVVICGKPNVGKSSLLNALLKKERSIVTPLAGTTRDTIEEMLDVQGIPLKIVDTAGILKPRGLIEKKAVRRSREHIKSADLVIILFDASRTLDERDRKLIKEVRNKNVIAVINKIDLKARINKDEIGRVFDKVVRLCAKSAKNINLLEEALCEFVYKGKLQAPEFTLVSNLRHIHALRDAKKLVGQGMAALTDKLPLEFIAQNIKDACVYLDRILGRSFPEDLLDRIFADFCIGK